MKSNFVNHSAMKAMALSFSLMTIVALAAPRLANACSGSACSPTCSQGLCVGDSVINLERDHRYATVLAIQDADHFVIRYEEGQYQGQVGTNWARSDLAATNGCSTVGDRLCVGQKVIVLARDNAYATIAGIQVDGQYVVYFESGDYTGEIGHGWGRSDLVCVNGI